MSRLTSQAFKFCLLFQPNSYLHLGKSVLSRSFPPVTVFGFWKWIMWTSHSSLIGSYIVPANKPMLNFNSGSLIHIGNEIRRKKLSYAAFLLGKFISFPKVWPYPSSLIFPHSFPLLGRFSMSQDLIPDQYHHSSTVSKLQLPPLKNLKCHKYCNLSSVRSQDGYVDIGIYMCLSSPIRL